MKQQEENKDNHVILKERNKKRVQIEKS